MVNSNHLRSRISESPLDFIVLEPFMPPTVMTDRSVPPDPSPVGHLTSLCDGIVTTSVVCKIKTSEHVALTEKEVTESVDDINPHIPHKESQELMNRLQRSRSIFEVDVHP